MNHIVTTCEAWDAQSDNKAVFVVSGESHERLLEGEMFPTIPKAPQFLVDATKLCETYGVTHTGSSYGKKSGGTGRCELEPPCYRGSHVVPVVEECEECESGHWLDLPLKPGGPYVERDDCAECDGTGFIPLGGLAVEAVVPVMGGDLVGVPRPIMHVTNEHGRRAYYYGITGTEDGYATFPGDPADAIGKWAVIGTKVAP